MELTEIRRANLIKQIGDLKIHGAVADFASRHNLNPDQVRHIVSGYRKMGEKLARKWETAIGLTEGELDLPTNETLVAAKFKAENIGEEAMRLLSDFEALSAERRAIALKMFQTLAELDAPEPK